MPGQLYEECYCGTEPVCADCMECEKHCNCEQQMEDRRQIEEFEAQNPGFLERHTEHIEDGAKEN